MSSCCLKKKRERKQKGRESKSNRKSKRVSVIFENLGPIQLITYMWSVLDWTKQISNMFSCGWFIKDTCCVVLCSSFFILCTKKLCLEVIFHYLCNPSPSIPNFCQYSNVWSIGISSNLIHFFLQKNLSIYI